MITQNQKIRARTNFIKGVYICAVVSVASVFHSCAGRPVETTAVDKMANEKRDIVSDKAEQIQAEEIQVQQIQEEVSIGRSMASKILGTFGYLDKHESSQKYLQLVGGRLVKYYGRSELNYFFGIIDDDIPNALATPGGYIFVTKGLLREINDESELAGVLAHELIHINNRHMYLKVRPPHKSSSGETLSRVLSRGAGDIGRSLAQAVSAGMQALLEDGLSLENEKDADSSAVILASGLGYDPNGLSRVLERLAKLNENSTISKTHPPFDVRLKLMKETIKNEKLSFLVKQNQNELNLRFQRDLKSIFAKK